jgi:hypothetical protein
MDQIVPNFLLIALGGAIYRSIAVATVATAVDIAVGIAVGMAVASIHTRSRLFLKQLLVKAILKRCTN